MKVVPLHKEALGETSATLWVLLGAVGLVLMVASANVSNVMLVRAEARSREFAVRVALGAGDDQLAGPTHRGQALCRGGESIRRMIAEGRRF